MVAPRDPQYGHLLEDVLRPPLRLAHVRAVHNGDVLFGGLRAGPLYEPRLRLLLNGRVLHIRLRDLDELRVGALLGERERRGRHGVVEHGRRPRAVKRVSLAFL